MIYFSILFQHVGYIKGQINLDYEGYGKYNNKRTYVFLFYSFKLHFHIKLTTKNGEWTDPSYDDTKTSILNRKVTATFFFNLCHPTQMPNLGA